MRLRYDGQVTDRDKGLVEPSERRADDAVRARERGKDWGGTRKEHRVGKLKPRGSKRGKRGGIGKFALKGPTTWA